MSNELAAARIQRRGLMLVLSSPSGAGKTTLSRLLLQHDRDIELSVSVTTRAKRPAERDGVDYSFIDHEAFRTMVERDELLEYAQVFDHSYGTPRGPVERTLSAGRDMLFDIDWQGTQQLVERARQDLVSIFILPPSTEELERRLVSRAQDPPEVVARRMAKAADEMSHWAEYDYVIVNEQVDQSLELVKAILTAERLKRYRQVGLSDFVKSLRAGR
ncbi:guanylate kinase [Vineibacter terrae]|uniref:guanylate kinase n=1 Tax=Vineibacter terrae TaxID=2586908 RepID=UPI002E31BE76|nr:guanylate kinase [Vineibacter terrae]HEX2885580.1 guanylate kinase [Vineibacter terrae]